MIKSARRWPLACGLLAGLGALYLGLGQGTTEPEAWKYAARYTARVGLPIFLLIYAASSLLRLAPSNLTKALVRDRRWWGLAFATTHTVHFYALYMAVTTRGDSLTLLAPGAVAYLAILAMALTSNDAAIKAMGANWKRLHRAGIHIIWLVFFLAYAKRIPVEATMVTGLVGSALCAVAAGIRFTAWRKAKRG